MPEKVKPKQRIEDPEWARWAIKKTIKNFKDLPELMPLQDKLLSFGGDWVALLPECDLKALMEKGQLFKGKIILKKMHPDKSHINSAQLWHKSPETYQIATGWALCDDGMWDQHTWLLKGKNIIETTKPMKMYYGIILDDCTAYLFWYANH